MNVVVTVDKENEKKKYKWDLRSGRIKIKNEKKIKYKGLLIILMFNEITGEKLQHNIKS